MTGTYREIATDGGATRTLTEQPAPMLEWLKIADLRIDDRYQRPLTAINWKTINHIADNFDWCAFGPVLCAPVADGLFAVIDGQHRVHAAALCGIDRIPAMIVPVPPAKQALAFVKVNSGIRVSAHQTFRAEIAAGTPEARAIVAACEAAGCVALTSHPSAATKRARQIAAIGFLRTCIRAGHSTALQSALMALVAYDTKERAALYSDYILKPFVAAIIKTGVFDVKTLTAALQARDPFHTIEAASAYAIKNNKSQAAEKIRALSQQINAAQASEADGEGC